MTLAGRRQRDEGISWQMHLAVIVTGALLIAFGVGVLVGEVFGG